MPWKKVSYLERVVKRCLLLILLWGVFFSATTSLHAAQKGSEPPVETPSVTPKALPPEAERTLVNLIPAEIKLSPNEPVSGDYFGYAVAADKEFVVIGAPRDNNGGHNTGSAYVFRHYDSGWRQEAKLTADDAAVGDLFGRAVAISGNIIVVGARGDDRLASDAGATYVFRRAGGNWHQEAKLAASDAAEGDLFGSSVGISGDMIVIGAYQDDDRGEDSGAAYIFRGNGSNWSEEAKLTAEDGHPLDKFGFAVRISGDTVIIGAPEDNLAEDDAGSAYIFQRQGASWSQQAKLTAPNGAATDYFGNAVTIEDDLAVIGAPGEDNIGKDAGSVYVFQRVGSAWGYQAKLVAADGSDGDTLGFTVSLSGDTIVTGAPFDTDGSSQVGSAYIFQYNGATWGQQAKLTAPDAGDVFAKAVAIKGDTIILGDILDDENGEDAGSAYIFQRQGMSWSQQAKFLPSDTSPGDSFGLAVAISEDIIGVGVPGDDDRGEDAGSVYLFQRRSSGGWYQSLKLIAADVEAGDAFGWTVAIRGDTLIVGAPFKDGAGIDAGAAYLFQHEGTTWTQQAKLVASNAGAGDQFGRAVAIDGERAVVGAPLDDEAGDDAGAAYLFQREGALWKQQAKLMAAHAEVSDGFGSVVTIQGNTLAVGAPQDDERGTEAGAVYLFQEEGGSWRQQAKLTAAETGAGDTFGRAISLNGEIVAVGAPLDDGEDEDTGAVYLFQREGNAWNEQAQLRPQKGGIGDRFGQTVAAIGQTLVVGALSDDTARVDAGAIYFFQAEANGWTLLAKLAATDAATGDQFGTSLALADQTVVVGADQDDDGGLEAGSVYVYEVTVSLPVYLPAVYLRH